MSTDRFETPDEIEAALRKRDEAVLQWANTVTKGAGTPPPTQASSLTREWKDYIDAADKSWLTAAMSAVGETLGKERETMRKEFREALEREVMALKAEFLADRLDAERGTKRLKVVPPLIG